MRWWPSVLNPYLQNQPRDTEQTPSDPFVQSCCQRNWEGDGQFSYSSLCISTINQHRWAALWGEDVDQRWALQWRSSLKMGIYQCETTKPAGMTSPMTDIWLDFASFQFSGVFYCRKWDIKDTTGTYLSESSTYCYDCSSSHSDTPCSANLAAEFPE